MNPCIQRLKKIMVNLTYQKIIRYIFIGGLTTLISFGSSWIMVYPLLMNANLANTISVILAVLFAYITYKIYVFKSKCGSLKELLTEGLRFFSSRVVTMFIEIGGVFVLNTIIHKEVMLSKALMNVIVLILNYVLSQFLIFKRTT